MVVWIYGPQGTGRDDIARTICKRYAKRGMVLNAPEATHSRLRGVASAVLRSKGDKVPIIVTAKAPRQDVRKKLPGLIVASTGNIPHRRADLDLRDLKPGKAANAIIEQHHV